MKAHRTLDSRFLGIGVGLALAFLVGCATTTPVSGIGEDDGDGPSSDGGSAPVNHHGGDGGKKPTGDNDGGKKPTNDGGGSAPSGDGGSTPLSSVHDISAFSITAAANPGLAADVVGVITADAIALTLPAGTDVTALVPTIEFDGDSIAPLASAATDFTSPVPYVVTAADGSVETYTVTITVPAPTCAGTATTCSTSVYDRAVSFANANPTRPVSHGTWDQYCAALVYWFGGFSVSAASADDAYAASTIVSTDPTKAPIGAIHYWALGAYGHVGVDLLGEGAVVFMASDHIAEAWGGSPYLGVNNVASYSEASGGTYRGWSMTFNGHNQTISGGGACGAATVPAGCTIPQSTTVTTGAPDQAFIMRLQEYAAGHGYTGPIDGNSDAATWKAVQAGLASYGYTGPVNGLPGQNTYKAFQQLAADEGAYTGPVNGILGPNSFIGFAKYLNAHY